MVDTYFLNATIRYSLGHSSDIMLAGAGIQPESVCIEVIVCRLTYASQNPIDVAEVQL